MEAQKTICWEPAGLSTPFVDVPGLHNFRDIGGWPVVVSSTTAISPTLPEFTPASTSTKTPQDPAATSITPLKITGHIRPGILYRGPDTFPILPTGEAKLRSLNVKTEFDLRSAGQIVKAGGFREIEGIRRVGCPAFPDGEYSPEKAAERYVLYASDGTEGIVQAFHQILTHGPPVLHTLLTHLASLPDPNSLKPTPACSIHCTTGNNRSGVFIAIFLSLLGVPDSSIADEYALSSLGLAPTREAVVDRLIKSPVFQRAGGGGRERAKRMVGARRESMLAMLEMVEMEWGGAERYVREVCGVDEETVRRVRKLMVVELGEEDEGMKELVRAVEGLVVKTVEGDKPVEPLVPANAEVKPTTKDSQESKPGAGEKDASATTAADNEIKLETKSETESQGTRRRMSRALSGRFKYLSSIFKSSSANPTS